MRMSLVTTAVWLCIVGIATADDAKAAVKKSTNIPAQPLANALQALAEQRDFQVVYLSDSVDEFQTSGAVGHFTADEAIEKLLSNTGLSYRQLDENTITVFPLPTTSLLSTHRSDRNYALRPTRNDRAAPSVSAGSPRSEQRSFWARLRLAQADQAGARSDGSPQTLRTTSDDRPSAIEEVIVTAQKREERLQDVPILISVLGGAELDASTAEGATEILNRVPGVAATETSQGGGTQIAIRGVTAGATDFSGSSPIAYYLDAVPFGFVKSAIAPDPNVYDLDRVEVLRGPQGTLYGASAQNGVVRVLTKDADLDELEFKARTSVSGTEHGGTNYRGDMAINVPLVEGRLGARVVAGYQDLSGWMDRPDKEDVNDGELVNLRLKVNAQPTDALSLGLSAWSSQDDFGAPSQGHPDRRSNAVLDESIDVEFDAYGLRIGYQFPAFAITSTTSSIDYTSGNVLDLLPFFGASSPLTTRFRSEVFAQEIVLSSTGGESWRWSLGGMYRDAEDLLLQPEVFVDFTDESESLAFFGELTRLFLDGRLELTAGLRHFQDDVLHRENVNAATGVATDLLPPSALSSDELSPRLVLTWHPNRQSTVYASYAEGFRSGFPQNANILHAAPQFEPAGSDTLKNYEVGVKGSFLKGRLSYEAAVYYMDWQDVQQSITVVIPPGIFIALVNGESASGEGVDFALTARPTEGLALGVNFSWNDLAMDSDVEAGTITPLFLAGDRLNYSPEYMVGASAEYLFALGGTGLKGRLGVSGNYTSEQEYRATVGTFVSHVSGDPMTMTRGSFGLEADSWRATLFIDNANNEQDAPQRSPYVTSGEWDSRVRPRTIGLQLDYQFR